MVCFGMIGERGKNVNQKLFEGLQCLWFEGLNEPGINE